MECCAAAVVPFLRVSIVFHQEFDHKRIANLASIVQWSFQQFVSGVDLRILTQKKLNKMKVAILCGYMEWRALALFLDRLEHLINIILPEVLEDLVQIADGNQLHELLVLIIVASRR